MSYIKQLLEQEHQADDMIDADYQYQQFINSQEIAEIEKRAEMQVMINTIAVTGTNPF